MFGGVVLWLALRNYRAVCPNCSLGVSLGALATFSGVALWPALELILWRNCRAVCPDCGHGPMGGNVGWTRESLILWAGVVACFLAALWGTFHLALLLAPGCSPGRCSVEGRVLGRAFRRPWGVNDN